jgi:hypothetical protein
MQTADLVRMAAAGLILLMTPKRVTYGIITAAFQEGWIRRNNSV